MTTPVFMGAVGTINAGGTGGSLTLQNGSINGSAVTAVGTTITMQAQLIGWDAAAWDKTYNLWINHAKSNCVWKYDTCGGWTDEQVAMMDVLSVISGKVTVPKRPLAFELPDGGVLHVDAQGNYRLDDSQARVIYQANHNKDFNPYLNASDLIARFIDYAGQHGVRKEEVGHLPLGLLIKWLIVEATEADGDPVPADVVPPVRQLRGRLHPRCLGCQRFIPRRFATAGLNYCAGPCAERHRLRLAA